MSYGFTRLVCINPPTKKEIQDWNPDLDEEAVSILLQLLNAENTYRVLCRIMTGTMKIPLRFIVLGALMV